MTTTAITGNNFPMWNDKNKWEQKPFSHVSDNSFAERTNDRQLQPWVCQEIPQQWDPMTGEMKPIGGEIPPYACGGPDQNYELPDDSTVCWMA